MRKILVMMVVVAATTWHASAQAPALTQAEAVMVQSVMALQTSAMAKCDTLPEVQAYTQMLTKANIALKDAGKAVDWTTGKPVTPKPPQMSNQYPYTLEGDFGRWYASEVERRYVLAGRKWTDDLDYFVWYTRLGYSTGEMTREQAAEKHLAELDQTLGLTTVPPVEPTDPDPPEPPIPVDRLVKPVVGYVRTEGTRWADDSGLRSFRVCSWFPALKCYRDHRDAALRQLDDIARHWQGVRIFWHVWTARWGNPTYSVDPRWPDFDSLFVRFLQDCKARDLRVSLSCGDMQDLCPDGHADDWYAHIAGLVGSVDDRTVSWNGVVNEGWQNMVNGDNPSYVASLADITKEAFPWGAHALTDTNEEPSNLTAWSRAPSNNVMVHGTREFPHSLRRAFNLVYDNQRKFLLNQDEPVGAGPDVFARDDDPQHLFALYTMHVITGQMTTFFGGHALKSWTPTAGLDLDWGFRELPTLWRQMNIPEDIQSWTIKPGHHADSAIYPTTFADRGQGPERCDGVQSATDAWFIPSGGKGLWELRSRWDATVRVWRPGGLALERAVSAGELFLSCDASVKAFVVESHRR